MREKPRPDGKTKCGLCKRSGHNARTCPNKTATVSVDDDDEPDDDTNVQQPTRTAARSSAVEPADQPRSRREPASFPPPRLKVGPDGKLRALDTTTVAIGARETCPHGNGSPARCSQCVLAGAKVTSVAIVGGNVVVDGAVTQTLREHSDAARPYQATRGAEVARARKARKVA